MKVFKSLFVTAAAALVCVFQAGAQEKDFVENLLPRLDAGLKYKASLIGTIQFLVMLFILGANLGFNSKFLYYVIANIATTEVGSYLVQEGRDFEVSGNSIFGYTNYAMCVLIWWRQGWARSSWPLTICAALAVADSAAQFLVPAASKILHLLGAAVGVLWYYFGYGFK